MSDLFGRFLSFEEHLGRGLVKATYFVALFYVTVTHLYQAIKYLIAVELGDFLLVPFAFLLWVMALRVGAELLLAILSIDDQLQDAMMTDGVESGLTPSNKQAAPDVPTPAKPVVEPIEIDEAPAPKATDSDGTDSYEAKDQP